MKPEDPTLALARLQAWLRGHDEDHPKAQRRTASVWICGDDRYEVKLNRDRPDGRGVFVMHNGEGDSLADAIDRALAAAQRGLWRTPA